MEEVEKNNPLMVKVTNVFEYAFSDEVSDVIHTILKTLESKYGEEFRVTNLAIVLCMMLAHLIDNQRELKNVNDLIELFYSVRAVVNSK
jgi:hypothetical protein